MRFAILGSLEIIVDGEPVTLRRNRQLVVLAMLLLHANQAVSMERLIDAVWPGGPPKTATSQIRTCIWSLRRTLDDKGDDDPITINTNATGYTLRVADGTLDVHEFERWAGAMEAAVARHDVAEAITHGRRALEVVRGPVLAEIDSPAVQALAAQWEERRLTVLEECIELELGLGRYASLIPELTGLVRQYPLRERLCEQLMLALHGDGRRAEALSVYRAGRQVLVVQLGLEPGPRLQALHGRILAGEPVAAPAAPARPAAAPPPAQLPPAVADFVGRDAEAAEVAQALVGTDSRVGPNTCVLVGPCGVGKTALAVRVAHQVRDRFPDGQLYAELNGSTSSPADPAEVLRGFLLALGVPSAQVPAGTGDRLTLYRGLLGSRRVLVVLDDVADAAQVNALLPAGSPSAVLVTSRTVTPDAATGRTVHLHPPTEDEAVAVLATVVGSERVADDPVAARRVVAAAGHLPLTVRAVGTRLAARRRLPLEHVADRLEEPGRQLEMLVHGGLDIVARLATTVHSLPPAARRLWCELALVPVPNFGAWVAASAHGIPVREAESLLDLLVDHSLVELVGVDPVGVVRYQLNAAIKACALHRATADLDERDREDALRRVALAWLGLADVARGRADAPDVQGLDEEVVSAVLAAPAEWLAVERAGVEFATRYLSDVVPAQRDRSGSRDACRN